MNWHVKKFKLNLKKLTPRLALILAALILVISLGGFYGYRSISRKNDQSKNRVDCAELSRNTDELISQSRYQDANDSLQSHADECKLTQKIQALKPGLNAEKKLESIKQLRDSAVKSYTAGDAKQAKVYADQAIKIRNTMNPTEFKILSGQLPDLNGYLGDVYEVQNGSYRVKMTPANPTEKAKQ